MTGRAGEGPILVTGAAGFVGAAAVHDLLGRGTPVQAVVRPGSRPWRLAPVAGRLPLHATDLTDADAVQRLIAAVRPSVLLHLAAHGAYESQADSGRILTTNVLGTLHLLEAAAACGVELVVNAGSSSEYGFKSQPMRETDRLDPNSVYAIAKAAQTHLCGLFGRRTPTMAVVTLRLFSVYGPWEEPSRLIPTLIRRARAGLPLEMVAPEVARDFVFVGDVLRALLDFDRLRHATGEVINLGSGVMMTLGEVVAAVQDLFGHRSRVVWGGMRARSWDTTRWVADPSRAARILDWRPTVGFREGLARTAEWMATIGADPDWPDANTSDLAVSSIQARGSHYSPGRSGAGDRL
ncbi:MAG TPA: NAD-dependent epimerase/dehydratase family protein [Isosphaeraceae bacterium]|nr:NAD-dependent epimerase/dehydratase family protein [Isosphaeraceae bacterium]